MSRLHNVSLSMQQRLCLIAFLNEKLANTVIEYRYPWPSHNSLFYGTEIVGHRLGNRVQLESRTRPKNQKICYTTVEQMHGY